MVSELPLEGKVVLITGAADRAGREFALRFAAAGASVVINHIAGQEELAAGVVAQIEATGRAALAVRADIATVDQAQALVEATVSRFGQIDVLVHNASTFRPRAFIDVTEHDFDSSFGVNVRGPFFLSQAAARVMLVQGSGRILALVGNSLTEAWPEFVPHVLSKTALARLMEQLAVALSPVIACNAIAPTQFFRSNDGANDALRASRGETVPDAETYSHGSFLIREVDLDAVFEALLYFSTCSRSVTGVTMRLDGAKVLV